MVTKKAEQFFNKAISLEPENVEFYRNLAYTYKANSELDKYNLKMEEIAKMVNTNRGQNDARGNKKDSRKK